MPATFIARSTWTSWPAAIVVGGAMLHPLLRTPPAALRPPRQRPCAVLSHPQQRPFPDGRRAAARPCRDCPLTVASAGTDPATVEPDAVATLAALGIDIAPQRSKRLDAFHGQIFDHAITVCDQAREECPRPFLATPPRATGASPTRSPSPGRPQTVAPVFAATAEELTGRVDHLLLALDAGGARMACRSRTRLPSNRHHP